MRYVRPSLPFPHLLVEGALLLAGGVEFGVVALPGVAAVPLLSIAPVPGVAVVPPVAASPAPALPLVPEVPWLVVLPLAAFVLAASCLLQPASALAAMAAASITLVNDEMVFMADPFGG
jgi:hypothetical protein